jgi:AcrR family transcriptional regulator/predicted DNA-binding transcriptional regulator AlpA
MIIGSSDNKTGMKIAELSITSGISKPTIHNYLRMGLLPPALKTGLNLHLYSETHLEALINIRLLKEKGYSLTQIKEALINCSETKAELSADTRIDSNVLNLAESDLGEQPNPDKWQMIIDKAIFLFSNNGYESVKISDITDSMGIGKGTFYLYFKNKREVLLECFKQLKSLILNLELREQIREEQDIIVRMFSRWAGFQSNYENFVGILLLLRISANSSDPTIRQKSIESYEAIIQPIRDDLQDAVNKGIVREVDPELIAYIFVGIAELLSFRLSLDAAYTPETVKGIVENMIKGILLPVTKPET